MAGEAKDAVKEIIEAVRLIDPALVVTSIDRSNAGFHSKHAAVDFGCADKCRLYKAFLVLCDTWIGGVGIGLPPHADVHLHVDARHSLVMDEKRREPWPEAQWVETGRGAKYSEVVRQGVSKEIWEKTLARVKAEYCPRLTQ